MQNLCIIRHKLGYTQEDFAKVLDISQSYLSKLENGNIDITWKNICDFSEKLGVCPFLIVGFEYWRCAEYECCNLFTEVCIYR